MAFKRITRIETRGLSVRDLNQLSRLVSALKKIDSRAYNYKAPETQDDFELISRKVVYQSSNRLVVEQIDLRFPETLRYYEEF